MLPDSVYDLTSLISRQATGDDEQKSPVLIKVFIAFHLVGLFGTLLMLLTLWLSRSTTPRHSTWFSFAFSWIISTVSYTLLFWGGRLSGPEPEYTLCLIQGILIYAASPLTAATTLALVIQIWFLVRSVVTATPSNKSGRTPPLVTAVLLVVPYIFFISIVVGTLVIGWQDPRTVRRVGSGMYCSFRNKVPGRLSTILVASIMIPAVVLEVLICRSLRRQWTLFLHQKDSLPMILRVVLFTFFGIVAVALSLLFFVKVHHGSELNIVISTLPIAAVVIFGTQPDLIRTWIFWKKRPQTVIMVPGKLKGDSTPILPVENRFIILDIHA
ncbi:hypothetical protein Hypma_003846 [Hypsizygus marmoreus]|uniref:G-protein coupled receptors family 2 profile 2 domain-containing protein n=1 Tax=Hypsizygus marmoreus TaxID=39966 RepID=A0A369K4A8_HYPMA|nr:hypothetical protein Hypma_003846 [Hypsizygus marmoreus]